MNVPIRALRLATSIFWILLVTLIALSAFSLKDLNFSIDEPEFTMTTEGKLLFSLPIYIENRGYCDIKNFHIATTLSDAQGKVISKAETSVPLIPAGESTTLLHNSTLNTADILQNADLLNDATFIVQVAASITFADFIPAQISTNFTVPWNTVLYNFAINQPALEQLNSTNNHVTVPTSFEKPATFDLEGTLRAVLFKSTNSVIGENQTHFQAQQHSVYLDDLAFCVPLNGGDISNHLEGQCNVYFSAALFECDLLVIPHG